MSIHDPLLPPPPPQSRKPEASRRPRRPSPAASARILATGLATTAMLGLTTGYAFARKAQQPEPSPNLTTPEVAGNVPPQTGVAPQTPAGASEPTASTPVLPTPGETSSQSADTAPPVVEIPVPDVAPAQPGNNWNGGNNQPSSGSN